MKSICIPCSGPVDVQDFLPVIDHPAFQRLRDTKQLGLNTLIFPGAQHSRFEHALGVLARTRRAAMLQHLTAGERREAEMFALLHDIGHGPFSHQVEPVLPMNHHQNGLRCIAWMAEAICLCGVSPDRMREMLSEAEDPLAQLITDRNLGTDKLDYLQRDAFHIGFVGTPDIDVIQQQTIRLSDGRLALHEKFIEEGKRLQKFYSYLHQHGYLNKTALSAQRLLQRALQEELLASGSDGKRIWDMTDAQLMAFLQSSRVPLTRYYIRCLQRRQLFRTCLCIKPDGYSYVENAIGKEMAVVTLSRAALSHFSQRMTSLGKIRDLENRLSAAVGLPEGRVVLAAMPYFTKLLPRDLMIANGGNGHDYWLFEQDHDHRASLESDYLRTFSIRVIVPAEYRAQVAVRYEELLAVMDLDS